MEPSKEQQLDNLAALKVDAAACMSAASRMLSAHSAADLRPDHIVQCREWLSSATELIEQLDLALEQRMAQLCEQDRQQRHDELMRRDTGAWDRMARTRIGLPMPDEMAVLA